jgi:Protein of unknown function (DUF3108)
MRWRTLCVLIAGVLFLHWGLLSGQASAWSFAKPAQGSLRTRTIAPEPTPAPTPVPAPELAAVVTPAPKKAATPTPKKTPSETKEIKLNSALIREKPAQAATESVANKPPEPPTIDNPVLPDDRISSAPTASTQTVEKSLDQQLIAGQKPGDPATVADPVELTFPASGSFAYNVLSTGTETQTGSGTLEWSSDGRTYQLVLEAKKFGISFLRQTSAGNVSEAGLKPDRYTDKRGLRSEQATHFQPDKGVISFANNKPNAPWISGAQDRLSVMMQLAGMVSGDPEKMLAQRTISMPVASTDDTETWTFALEGRDELKLPAGTTTALHLVRYPRKEFDRKVELWLAPQLDYMPVRIKQTEQNGNTLELSLRSPALKPELPKNTDPTLR